MKKLTKYCLYTLITLCRLTLSVAAEEPKPPAKDLSELYTRLSAISPKITKAGYTILHIEFDRLAPGGEYLLKRDLNHKYKYKLVAVATSGITDLQLRVIDSAGKVKAKDPNSDNVAIVNLIPDNGGQFSIKLGAAKITGNKAYFFCLIASKANS